MHILQSVKYKILLLFDELVIGTTKEVKKLNSAVFQRKENSLDYIYYICVIYYIYV